MVLLKNLRNNQSKIGVLGSANIDIVVRVKRLPAPGETMLVKATNKYPGGKGANQAVAAARLGAFVTFFGKIGNDEHGNIVIGSLRKNKVNVDMVISTPCHETGTAYVIVAETGENIILYLPGANDCVDMSYVDMVIEELLSCDILLLQLEIPIETIKYVLERLPRPGPCIVLDPAPAKDISLLPLESIDIITPNQAELETLTGSNDPCIGGRRLLAEGVGKVICKVGADGAWVVTDKMVRHIPGYKVPVIDTTAAGDAFNGALAFGLAMGLDLMDSVVLANAAGALACTREGAQPSLPFYKEVAQLLQQTSV
ncbi:MAG: ribokinase [Candidatus Methanomethyliaceae archaeon]